MDLSNTVDSSLDAEEITIQALPVSAPAELAAQQEPRQHVKHRYFLSWRFLGTWAGLVFCILGVSGSYNVPTSILGAINADLGPTPQYANITIVWTLMSSVSLLIIGRVTDIFGRRYFLLGSMALGFIGAIMAARASSIPVLIGANAFLGVSSPPASSFQLFLGELVPIRHRGYWTAVTLTFIIPTQMFGPTLGQLYLIHLSWRWIYYVSAIFYAVSVTLLAVSYFPPSFGKLHKRHSKWELTKHFDYIGVFLYSGGAALFILGISWGGSYFPWKSATVISTLTVGCILLISFVIWAKYSRVQSPLVSWRFFAHEPRRYLFPFVASSIGGMLFYAVFLVIPLEVAYVYPEKSPMQQGWLNTAAYSSTISGSLIGGILFTPGGRHRLKCVIFNAAMIAFCAGASQTQRPQLTAHLTCVCLAGFSCGLLETSLQLWMSIGRGADNIGLSLGLLGAARCFAGALASAVYIAVFTNKATTLVPAAAVRAALQGGLPQSSLESFYTWLGAAGKLPLDTVTGFTPTMALQVQEGIADAYVESFRYIFYLAAGFAGLGLIFMAASVPNIDDAMTNYIAKSLYNGNGEPTPLEEKTGNVTTPKETALEGSSREIKEEHVETV